MILSRRNKLSSQKNADDLQRRIETAVARNADWLEIWSIYSEHPWIQQQLQIGALNALQRLHAPRAWSADVKQETLIRIGIMLRKDPTLGFDAQRGSYAGWLYCLIQANCLKALRQFRDEKRMKSLKSMEPRTERSLELIQRRMDLVDEIERLEGKQRELLRQHLRGESVEALAEAYGVSTRTIYRLIHDAQERLRRHLSDE